MKKLTFNSIEPFIFFGIVLINLMPLFAGKFFPTMDGPSHLNNATLIKEILFNGSDSLNQVFRINPEPVPNWIGHFILVFLKLFFPSYLAEKILLLIYFIGLPLAFRGLIKTISPNNILYSYFIFPFTYSSLLLFGFYNFSFGIIFYLISITYWIKVNNSVGLKENIILFLLVIATYFSHIFLFAILLTTISINIIFSSLHDYFNKPEDLKIVFANFLKKTIRILLVSIVPGIFFVFYIISRNSLHNSDIVPINNLISWIKNIRPIIAYNPPLEEAFTTKIFYIIAILVVIGGYTEINNMLYGAINKKSILTRLININNSWLIVFFVLFCMYFFLPLADDDDAGGFFKVRLALLFFIILLIWISTLTISKWMNIIAISIMLFFHFKLNEYYATVIKELDIHAQECYELSQKIPANSVVLPVDVSGHWLKGHFSNYLGSDNPLIILDNYECTKGYFPVIWNENSFPNYLLNGKNPDEIPCLWWKSNQKNEPYEIDYVFVLGDVGSINESCLQENILFNLEMVYQSTSCSLFKSKK